MSEQLINRAHILIQQNRYKEAEGILADVIGTDPNNSRLLGLYSDVLLELGKNKQAEAMISNAIGLTPDFDFLYYIKARVMLRLKKYDQAENSLEEAITLDPSEADYYALWASIKLARKQFDDALQLADRSLELDPENILGLNTRSTALLRLNKKDESLSTIEGALNEDPNNAFTHSTLGWNLLENGDHKKALVHFKEALKNDPNFEFAQAGMVEALKARYFLYRWFLKYAFWMSKLTAKYQWGVIIGFYILFRVLRGVAERSEALQPYLTPLLVLLALFAFSTWVINPISNLFFRLNTYGKHLLNKKEMLSSNFVALSAVFLIAGLVLYAWFGEAKWLTVAAFGLAMMVPFSVMFAPSTYKYSLVIYAGAMFFIGIVAIAITFNGGEIFNMYSTIFVFGFIAFQWIANFLMIKEDNI